MAAIKKRPWPPSGYPTLSLVERGCGIIGTTKPENVFVTINAKLHNLGLRKTAAHLQVFDIATKAAQWMLRDLRRHEPLRLFGAYRKRNSTSYNTDRIADAVDRRYRALIRSRFTLNSSVFGGLCSYLANNISSWLQKMTEAESKGQLRRHQECSLFIATFGKHKGKTLKELGRDTIFGYAFLQQTKTQCETTLRYLDALLSDLPEEAELREEAEAYRVPSGRRQGDALGSMRPETWRRMHLLTQRDLDRMGQMDEIRKVAQDFLRFTPPGFPGLRSGVLSPMRRNDLQEAYLQAINDYAALPNSADEDDADGYLTANERALFRELQQQAYAATNTPHYITLQWDRADGAVNARDAALLYEPATGQYLFMAHILHTESHHRRPMTVQGDLIDVNNPQIHLNSRERPSIANLYELEFSGRQRQLLDRARGEAELWKSEGKCSGAIRSAKLQAHYDKDCDAWWFDVMLAVGFKPQQYRVPQHVVGVHINPKIGWFIRIVRIDGPLVAQFQLDELRIAQLLANDKPSYQAGLKPGQRTAKERSHRYADAITAICEKYDAICAVENIGYRSAEPGPQQLRGHQDSSRTVFMYLKYKLPLLNLPAPLDIKGVAPQRDCGACGYRHEKPPVEDGVFCCQQCKHCAPVALNAAQEVARRALWLLALRKPPRPKKAKKNQTDVHSTKAM